MRTAKSGPRFSFGASQFAGAAVAALLVGGSVYTATRHDGLRVPVHEVIPEVAVAPAPVPQPAAPAQPKDGPAIIKVNPAPAQTNGPIVIRDPSTLSKNPRTAHLPDRALLEDSPSGPLPIRGADGRRPFEAYAGAWSGTRGAKVAIIIGGLGVSQTGTQAAIKKLPGEVTFAFASQGNSLSRWMQAARQSGHEIVMQVPLEPFDYPAVDPGRNTLTVDGDPAQNIESLHWALSRTTNYTGIMNYMGGRFITDRSAMEPLMKELGKRGLMFVDDGSSARSVAAELALGNAVPFAAGEGVIDGTRERGAILKKLDQLEAAARAKGFAIGTGSAFDETVDAVSTWVAEAKKRGIEIVPVSALASDPEASR